MAEPTSATLLFRRILREPTSHFVLLAAVLFAANAALEAGRGNVITVDRVQIDVRIAELEAIRGAPLSPEERQLVEDAYIDEQVLVREALDMGLEADRRIDDILVQKMLHVLSGDVIQPTEDELREFYKANRASHTPESTLTIEEVVIAGDSPAAGDLVARLRVGASALELAENSDARSSVLRAVTGGDLRRLFGPVTAELILSANTEGWIGPHEDRPRPALVPDRRAYDSRAPAPRQRARAGASRLGGRPGGREARPGGQGAARPLQHRHRGTGGAMMKVVGLVVTLAIIGASSTPAPSVFGLLHGLGFAGALGEIGLRASDVPVALLFFNLGVEAGQLAFVVALIALAKVAGRARQMAVQRVEPVLGYALGAFATFWFLDRLPALWGA